MTRTFRYARLMWHGHFHLHLRGSWVSYFVAQAWAGNWQPYEELFRLRPIGWDGSRPIYFGDAPHV